jgi:hypothetical protein
MFLGFVLIASKQLPVRNRRAFLLPEWIFREENLRLRQRDRVTESSKQSNLWFSNIFVNPIYQMEF